MHASSLETVQYIFPLVEKLCNTFIIYTVQYIIYRPGARRIWRNITRSDDMMRGFAPMEIRSLRIIFRRILRVDGLYMIYYTEC